MVEIYGRDATVLEGDSLDRSKDLKLVAPYLEEAPLKELCGDIVMGSDTPSIWRIEPMCTEPLDLIPTSSPLLPITPSHDHACHESPNDIGGYYFSLALYFLHTWKTWLEKSCGVLSVIMDLIFLWQKVSLRDH